MATSQPAHPSVLRRAFTSQPFVWISLLAVYYMDIPGMMRVPPPVRDGKIVFEGVSAPMVQKFFMVPFLDEVIGEISKGFMPFAFYDPVSWWQALIFMNDVGVIYMIALLESSRGGFRGTLANFPVVLATLAQFGGGGVLLPFTYFVYLAFCPPIESQPLAQRRINLDDAMLYPIVVFLAHYIPANEMFFAPVEDRHWWIFLWQLYPVYISIGFYVLRTVRDVIGWPKTGPKTSYHTVLWAVLGPAIAVSNLVWMYTLSESPYTVSTIFYPAAPEPGLEGTFHGLMRRVLQVDYIACLGALLLWLLYGMWDWIVGAGNIGKLFLLLTLIPIIGPAATCGVMWLVREMFLVAPEKKDSKKE